MHTLVKRFAPLLGIMALLIGIAITGTAIASSQQPPKLDSAEVEVKVKEKTPAVPPADSGAKGDGGTPAPQDLQAPQTDPAPVPTDPNPAAPVTTTVVTPEQPLVYGSYSDDDGDDDVDTDD